MMIRLLVPTALIWAAGCAMPLRGSARAEFATHPPLGLGSWDLGYVDRGGRLWPVADLNMDLSWPDGRTTRFEDGLGVTLWVSCIEGRPSVELINHGLAGAYPPAEISYDRGPVAHVAAGYPTWPPEHLDLIASADVMEVRWLGVGFSASSTINLAAAGDGAHVVQQACATPRP